MTKPLRHTIAPTPKDGVKGPLEDLLRTRSESPDKAVSESGLTLGEILRAMNLDKTRNGDVSAALHKLRTEGHVAFDTGPRSSATGPRFVKRYRWRKKAAKPSPAAPPNDDRRFLSLCR
jgi:hypothetical protein